MELLFCISLIMIAYAYFGYPFCLLGLHVISASYKKNNISPRPVNVSHAAPPPSVSFIITAYNEEARIQEKIEGTLALNYPQNLLEVIVASDCSTDETDAIVASYADKGVKLIRAPERKGKENAQGHAVAAATGEILVFSDVATILETNAVETITKNFSDPSIGCVSSEDRFIDEDGNVSGEGAYVRYEMFLRRLESKVNTLVGLSGSFFAARREVCKDWSTDLQSDFNTLLNSIKLGLRGTADPDSIGYYKNIADEKKEYERKVRTVLRGISVLMRNVSLLNPFFYGTFSWQLFSHKVCRWLVPFFLIAAFISNLLLLFTAGFYFLMFVLQGVFYFLAYEGYKQRRTNSNKADNLLFFKVPYYFVTVNISILVAWWRYFKGERATFWEPSKR